MELKSSFRDARAEYAGDVLVVSNSVLERRWRWTGKGFVTVRVKSTVSGHEFLWTHQGKGGYDCDWQVGQRPVREDRVNVSRFVHRSGLPVEAKIEARVATKCAVKKSSKCDLYPCRCPDKDNDKDRDKD